MTAIKAIDERGEISDLLLKISEGCFGARELGQLVQWTRRWLVLWTVLEKGKMTFKDLKELLPGFTTACRGDTD